MKKKEGYAWKPEQEEWIAEIFDREMKKKNKASVKIHDLAAVDKQDREICNSKIQPGAGGMEAVWKL